MNKILDVVEDIKQNITDNQYKTIMDSLMEINKIPVLYDNHKNNNFICLLYWLDTKLEITEYKNDCIKRGDLQKYVITNYFDCRYFENIDFVNIYIYIYIMFSTKEQNCSYEYEYVKFRD